MKNYYSYHLERWLYPALRFPKKNFWKYYLLVREVPEGENPMNVKDHFGGLVSERCKGSELVFERCSGQWFSKCGPLASSIRTTQELVRNAKPMESDTLERSNLCFNKPSRDACSS